MNQKNVDGLMSKMLKKMQRKGIEFLRDSKSKKNLEFLRWNQGDNPFNWNSMKIPSKLE